MVVKSHFDRNSRAAVCASVRGWPVMLDDTSMSRNTRISSGRAAVDAVSGGRPSHDRSSGTGSTVIGSRCAVSRCTACTCTTPLESYDKPTSIVTSASVGVDAVEDVLAQNRAIERSRALPLRQIDLEPRVGAAVSLMKVRLGVAGGDRQVAANHDVVEVFRAVGADGDRAQAVRHHVGHPAAGSPRGYLGRARAARPRA